MNIQENKTLYINRLLYIGESDNVQNGIKEHDLNNIWKQYCLEGEEPCFNFGEVKLENSTESRKQIEEALIFKHMPPCNKKYVNSTNRR